MHSGVEMTRRAGRAHGEPGRGPRRGRAGARTPASRPAAPRANSDPRPSGDASPVHTPVLAAQVVEHLGDFEAARQGGWILDLTVGAGGHAASLLEHARRRLASFGHRARVRRARMSALEDVLHAEGVDRVVAVLIDLGVSSLQLDSAGRGFSFQEDGPLDMRMDPDRDRTAADVINRWDEGDLADLFYYEGGETRARKVARAIVESRRRAPFRRTLALAELVERALGGRRGRTHPATRVFQALRRAVNQEGEELEAALELAERWLVDGGRLGVLSFHSGEDGAVKRFLARGESEGRWRPLAKRPLRAPRSEVQGNPRARSAALRLAARTRLEGGQP